MEQEIIRELPRIARRAREEAGENAGFREYVKERLPLSNDGLDAVVRETTDAVWREIDCTECAACCRLQIVVDEKDVRRLAGRLGVTVREFASRYVGVADDGIMHFVSAPCPFLGQDNWCMVYEDRPKACRDYPYLYEKRFRARTLTMLENVGTCPIVFNVWERLKAQFPPPGPAMRSKGR